MSLTRSIWTVSLFFLVFSIRSLVLGAGSELPVHQKPYDAMCSFEVVNYAKVLNVRNYGAIGDGKSHPLSEKYKTLSGAQIEFPLATSLDQERDDAAIEKAVADAMNASGVTIYFPSGTYFVSKESKVVNKKLVIGAVDLNNLSNVTFLGDDTGKSVLTLKERTWKGLGDVHMFYLKDSDHIGFKNLSFNGQYRSVKYPHEQFHGVYINNSSRIVFDSVTFHELRGDGIFTISDDKVKWAEDILVMNSRFDDNGRSGAAHQGGTRRICYKNNIFEKTSDQDLDFEVTGTRRGAEDVWIVGNIINHSTPPYALTPTGKKASKGLRWRILGNQLNGGSVMMRSIDDLIFSGNTLTNPVIVVGKEKRTFEFGDIHNATFSDNKVETNNGREVIYFRTEPSNKVLFTRNQIRQTGKLIDSKHTNALMGSENFSSNNITISGNTFIGSGPTKGVEFKNVAKNVRNTGLTIAKNVFQNTQIGVAFLGRESIGGTRYEQVAITGNSFDSSGTGGVGILFGKENRDEYIDPSIKIVNNSFGKGVDIEVLDPKGKFNNINDTAIVTESRDEGRITLFDQKVYVDGPQKKTVVLSWEGEHINRYYITIVCAPESIRIASADSPTCGKTLRLPSTRQEMTFTLENISSMDQTVKVFFSGRAHDLDVGVEKLAITFHGIESSAPNEPSF